MKRGKLLKELDEIAKRKGLGLDLVRHGANHDLYQLGDVRMTIGRHPEIPERTARNTLKDAEEAEA